MRLVAKAAVAGVYTGSLRQGDDRTTPVGAFEGVCLGQRTLVGSIGPDGGDGGQHDGRGGGGEASELHDM